MAPRAQKRGANLSDHELEQINLLVRIGCILFSLRGGKNIMKGPESLFGGNPELMKENAHDTSVNNDDGSGKEKASPKEDPGH